MSNLTDFQQSIRQGIPDYLSKPYDPDVSHVPKRVDYYPNDNLKLAFTV